MKRRLLTLLAALVVAFGLAPSVALASNDVPSGPTGSGNNLFANGVPITIAAEAPKDGTQATIDSFTATGTSAYVIWEEDDKAHYIGVNADASVYGGANGATSPVTVENTSITMTGGEIKYLYGGNNGAKNRGDDTLSRVTGDVHITMTGGYVSWLLHGGGANNTCVEGTVYMNFEGVDLDGESQLYVNGGVYGTGAEGTRDIKNGKMDTSAVANKVVITAKDSHFYLLGVGGSGSTKVSNGNVTLDNCSAQYLFLGGINGEVVQSGLTLNGCTVENFSATNRGFVGDAKADINGTAIASFSTGAASGCFSSDAGTPDGSGVTGSVQYAIDAPSTIGSALITPTVMRDANGYSTTLNNVSIEKEGEPLDLSIAAFSPVSGDEASVQHNYSIPAGSKLTLKNARVTVSAGQGLTNIGAIELSDGSSVTVAVGADYAGDGNVTGGGIVEQYAAMVNGQGFDTLQGAINAAGSGQTVTLMQDVSENVTVADDDNIVLDLNGFTLTNDASSVSSHTITNKGTLIIVDNSEAKSGTVDNVSHARAAIWNETGAVATLSGGSYTRSMENGQSAEESGGNSYYNLVNHGKMTINKGVTVVQDGAFSSMVENGWYNGTQNLDGAPSVMVIDGGTFSGGLNTIKNDDWGQLIINGGTFENVSQACVLNWNVTTVTGGTFESDKDVILNGSVSSSLESDRGSLTITGGTFVAGDDGQVIAEMSGSSDDETRNIQGGTFNKTPIASMSDKNYVVRVDGDESFTVMKKGDLGPGTYQTIAGDKLTADDFQPGLSISFDENGNVVATKPYVPPVQSGEQVKVSETDGGAVKVTPTRADEGDEVTITATPDEGKEVREVTVTDEDGKTVAVRAGEKDGEFVFEMPGSAVTVTVTFGCDGGELCPTHGFSDVDQSAWYHDAVDWAVENGVLNGYGEGGESLGPVADVTRAEMAQMLWNRAGRPEATADLSAFTDVDAEGWYAPALAWCVSEGIFSGYGDTFGTERTISREEAVTVLWRLSGSPEADADLSGYGDASSVSDYATGAIEWAVSTGVLTGKGGVALDPQAGCTRGEVAAMMMRMAR